MTNKKIIIDNKYPISEKCKEFENCKIQYILQQLKLKEQELNSCREELRWLHKMEAERNVIKSCMINTIVNLEEENAKLKQALLEIELLVYELTNEEYTDFIEEKQKQILNKISEVK